MTAAPPWFLFAATLGCGSGTVGPLGGGGADGDPTDAVYDPGHLLVVDIRLDPDDWDALRLQTRDADILVGEDCLSEPFGSPFTWFEATVTLDGQVFERVGVRKKGFLGSLSESKPSLKIDLEQFGEAEQFSGVERLTLNNSVSDPSLVRQCVGYGFYRDAGMPASRCAFARVSVNGEDLGMFVNLEPIKKDFLRRHFADDGGNLYEGTLSDFREGWTGTFEKKTNEAEDDWSDIDAVVAALEADDADLLDALAPVVDIDAFLTHWAAEVISVHTDGYAWNTNNYYLYDDPTDGRLHFIPWGIDACLNTSGEESEVSSVYAYGELANRLYRIDEGRELYLDRLDELLQGPWDEDVLQARIDQMASLLQPELGSSEADQVVDAIAEVRRVVENRRGSITDELAAGPPSWPYGQRDSYCIDFVGELEATFSTSWGSVESEDPFTYGDAALSVSLGDQFWDMDDLGAVAGWSGDVPVLFMVGWLSATEAVLVYMTADEQYVEPGTLELDWEQGVAALYTIDTATMEDFEFVAYIMGQTRFDLAGTDDGDPVTGVMTGTLMTWGR